jgi:hypothetical protein
VAVCIDGTCGEFQGGFARAGVPVKPPVGFGESTAGGFIVCHDVRPQSM